MAVARDPREIITPDAFKVAPELLGLPLARPARRAAAMLVDLALVGIIIKSISFTLFVLAAALLLFRVAKPSPRGGRLRRTVAWTVRAWAVVLIAVFGMLAFNAARDFVRNVRVTAGAAEADSAAAPVLEDLLAPVLANEPAVHGVEPVRAYVDAHERGDTVRAAELLAAAQTALAGERIAHLESSEQSLREQVRVLAAEAEKDEPGGLRRLIAGISDDLGVGFGWLAVYFTAFAVLWNGQTPGKRLLGIRIIRLDAKPLSWWLAFERFGGYAASFSTGLLGFAQILWDANRQGLHDKIIATVVIRERAPAGAAPRDVRSAPPPPRSVPPGSRLPE